jgi:hypothetical protein
MLRFYNSKEEVLYIISRYNSKMGGSTGNMYGPYSWLGVTSHLQQLQF